VHRSAALCLLAVALAGCGQRFSPDTYATRSVQTADKVEQGVIVGVRPVKITAEGSIGAATGAAAGGVVGSQVPGTNLAAALGGVGGALVGGLVGTAAEKTIVDTDAFEYIVRTSKGDLLRVTQQDKAVLTVGLPVLVITGSQARVVADYTVTNVVGTASGAASVSAATAGTPAPIAVRPEEAALPPVVAGTAAAVAETTLPAGARAVGQALAPIAAPPPPAYPALPPAPPRP